MNMFKLESYITPVILSYVEKYVKNFKPEQSQVSLWGGDATFQNLDLRLEVLEEQLNLPFDFVSGHIHELIIHVPWVKITSEPIVVTINTIECILKLKDESKRETVAVPPRKVELEQEEAPPGYIKSIVTKVVNNITINCNNLILKYVEEDIVLSVNVRFLSMQTVDNKWEPAFTDVNSYEVSLRKIISIQDLTLCLDKMDASGKIEIYQDPVLYRCSMTIRLIINYHSNTAKRASITRLDLHCQKMEFSITEQQIPMVLRLIALLSALQTKQLPANKEKPLISMEDREDASSEDIIQMSGAGSEAIGWGGWAWNMVSSLVPVEWENDWSTDQEIAYAGHTIHLGLYIDDAMLTFKTVESVKEQVFYKSRKLRYKSFLTLRLNAVMLDTLLQGIGMTSFQVGFGSVRLYPRGTCSCGHAEVIDGAQPPLYLVGGKLNTDYLKDSLFDKDSVENQGKKRDYKQGIDHHLAMVSVEQLLKKCPAFVMDYVHCVQLPEDITAEQLLEVGSNLERSNFPERRVMRYVMSDVTIRLSSGVFHRLDTIKQAAANYDYTPYIVPKPIPTLEELPPVTLEEYEALRENISMVETQLVIMNGCLQLQLADHRITGLPRQHKMAESRIAPLTPALTDDPFVSIECHEAVISMLEPLYSFRLAACAARQIDLSLDMFEKCHRDIKILISGAKSQLYLLKNSHTSMVMPFSVECSVKKLLYPQYWKNPDLIRESYSFEIDGITITGTKAKMMVATSIIQSLFHPTDTTNPLVCSSLFNDAFQENSPIYLELVLENIKCSALLSLVTTSMKLNVNSIKIFTLNDTQQAFILSGPEDDYVTKDQPKPLLMAIIQLPKDAGKQTHPPLLSFQVANIRGSLDPLFLQWLEYRVTYYKLDTLYITRSDSQQTAEAPLSDPGTRKKTFPSLNESVHSASDKEKKKSVQVTEKVQLPLKNEDSQKSIVKTDNDQENLQKSGILVRLAELYPWWSGLVLNGSIGHIVIYIPSTTMSGIGVDGIEKAKEKALNDNENMHILIIQLPSLFVNSSNITSETLLPYLLELPVKLPQSMWIHQAQCFPWTLKFLECHCYTLRGDTHKSFIDKVSLNATVALTTKSTPSHISANSLTALGLCVHIDNSPIIISISEEQVVFISDIISNIFCTLRAMSDSDKANTVVPQTLHQEQHTFPVIGPTPSTPTQIQNMEDATTTSTISTSKDESILVKDGTILTAWIQWTITKIAVKLYVTAEECETSFKLVLELEDIITSLDLQPVYIKLKNKITTATILHYVRAPQEQNWEFGEYVGLVLCGREDSLQKGEDLGFLNFTLTQAKAGNVHTRWGAHKRQKPQKKELPLDAMMSQGGYISEVVVKMQMVDVILPLGVFSKYIQLMKPLTRICQTAEQIQQNPQDTNAESQFAFITNLTNELLPLIYLEFKGLRVMIPATTNIRHKLQHDLLMLQLDGVSIAPHAENPICRTPLRVDIYQHAAQANILNIPGSAVEDRQYQINIKGVCTYTTTWKNYQLSINKRMSQSYLYTMNENPALEWNKLGNRGSLEPRFSTISIFTKFDICLVIAPMITFKPDTIVCGSAVEINCLTDLEITINVDQLKLISGLINESRGVLSEYCEDVNTIRQSSVVTEECSTPISEKPFKPNTWVRQPPIETEIDFTKDSGVDMEMSSINSTITGKSPLQEITMLPPFEFLVNCGKIGLILYETQKSSAIWEQQPDINEIEEDDIDNLKQPLLYMMIDQPNVYLLQQYFTQKIQISCYDVMIALGNNERQTPTSTPTEADFKTFIIETRNGEPHPDTGIPPSFATVKCEKTPGKNPQFSVHMGRPTKLHFSLLRLEQINSIKDKILSCFSYTNVVEMSTVNLNKGNTTQHHSSLKSNKANTPDLNINTNQIVLSLMTNAGSEIITSLMSLRGNISTLVRPDRIYSNISVNSLVVSVLHEGSTKVLLNPWCCNATVYLLWESWQEAGAVPQIQVQADSDSIYLDFGPDQVKIVNVVMEDCKTLLNKFSSPPRTNEAIPEKRIIHSTEQHYKDDLKSGAFQFIDGNADELPFPYQVIFFGFPQQAMAWRYPQPRTLTKIHISPVPFETSSNEDTYIDKLPCSLEYWSDSHMAYQHYMDFYLSETDTYRLDLPEKAPARAVACVWRVVILPHESKTTRKPVVSVRVLAACLRIDSYFNSLIVPNVQAALNIGIIHVSFYNHIDPCPYATLPAPLNNYMLKGKLPEMQCFMTLEQKFAVFVLNRWADGSTLIDISGKIRVHVLDYGYLNMQEVMDPLDGKFQLSLSNRFDASLVCRPFALKLSPAVSHTLAVSAHLWSASLSSEESNKKVIILTRYVVANDTNASIRFGQSGTDDNILLETRECCFYSWRQISNQTIRISIEDNAWAWSKPFSVNKDGNQVIEFTNGLIDTAIFVDVATLSATQKLITFFGQLIISNKLSDGFEMKMVKYEDTSEAKVTVLREVHTIAPNSRPPSVVIENHKKLAIRLRFTNFPNLSWTGDIPLQPNAKWGQPWLVKVPLQERGQFLSIWVRIVTQTVQNRIKILAVFSPLYMIRSYLPAPVTVQIDTPSLKTSISTIIHGRGQRQQLQCPGTFEHFHQLTFQLESGISASNPYVPLSYSSVDQRKFFKRPEIEDIEAILKELENQAEESRWPFQGDDLEEWIPAEQPQTHVQVKYEDAKFVSSTLLLELQPWCFMLNSLGCPISLISEDIELCQIPHYGIVTPPKLEGTFHLCIGLADAYYTSQPLQLARADWGQSFYMPRIGGLIPVEGNIKTCVDCGSSVAFLNISSKMQEDMRLVRIASSHAIGNMTSLELHVAALAVHETATDLHLPHDLDSCSFNVPPMKNQKHAVPVVQWYTFDMEDNTDATVPYVVFNLGYRWSCPVRVDKSTGRRCVAIPTASSTIPVVITMQEDKGTVYVTAHLDDHPQLFIENSCNLKIIVGQANETTDGIIPDAAHFSWMCEVESGTAIHYSLPAIASRMPDLPFPSSTNILLLSGVQISNDNGHLLNRRELKCSRGINLSVQTGAPTEQFIRLPPFGDIKLLMHNRCYTVYISIVPTSQVEVSVRDIRSRLMHKENRPSRQEMTHTKSYLDNCERNEPGNSLREQYIGVENVKASNSSSSITSFYTAQEDSTTMDSLASSPDRHRKLVLPTKQINPRNNQFKTAIENCEAFDRQSSIVLYVHGITIIIMQDINENGQRIEVASLSTTDLITIVDTKSNLRNICFCIGDLQLDNQMFDQGGFDFPVVLISQRSQTTTKTPYARNCLVNNIAKIRESSLIVIDYVCETNGKITVSKDLRLKVAPISAYIEDTYITQLLDYATCMVPPCFVSQVENTSKIFIPTTVYVPDYITMDAKILSSPLKLQNFTIDPVSILLSVHTSVRLYVALDHSPLHFGVFERKNLLTTPYRLGNALTMHYLSGAIFGAGWVVGSLEILGSPGGLAQALGSGLKDFISLPFQGLLQGPRGFIVGITHGSASLMKHITAGTVNSVTKLASSVARNLDRLTLDEEHLHRQEESRRIRPQGMAQGLYQGLSGLGMSLLAAIAGLAHHPLQQVWSGEATTKGLVTGVGLGLVGVVTKPLSGAAELVALTGQGLLQGAGWNSLPSPRQRPVVEYNACISSASVRYAWRLLPLLENSHDSILHVTNADYVIQQGSNRPVTLVLTRQALLLVNAAEDSVERVLSLKDLTSVDHPAESTMLCLYCPPDASTQYNRPLSPAENEMDQEMRARVAEYVRTSSAGLASMSTNSDGLPDTFENSTPHSEHTVTFYVCSDSRNYLLSLFNIAKRQSQGNGFNVL